MKKRMIFKRIIALFMMIFVVLGSARFDLLTVKAANTKKDAKRYTVLVLDYSDTISFSNNGVVFYTAGTAIKYVQQAAKKFVQDISNIEGENNVAIVTYNSTASILSNFSTDYTSLEAKIDGMNNPSQTERSIAAGLVKAKELLSGISEAGVKKSVILLSTGMTNIGDYSYEGHYDDQTIASNWRNSGTDIRLYAYANSAYAAARELDAMGAEVYSLGVFQTVADIPDAGKDVAQFFELTAEELASNSSYFFSVDKPEELEFVFGEVANAISKDKITGTFNYLSGEEDYTARYYFDTDYFSESATIYKASLATMSICLAMSAFGSSYEHGYGEQYINAYNLLRDIGFNEDTIETNQYFKEKPQEDSMGVIVGQRELNVNGEDYTLLAVATRGAGYESEWAGNLTLGSFGNHEGFTKAANEVERFLKEYINKHPELKQKKVKLWITGYSRAAATANIVAGELTRDGGIGGMKLESSNIYAYCFEPPMGINTSEVSINTAHSYNNIHNIVNPDDLVPRVAMKVWGFTRYGKDENVIPAITTMGSKEKYNAMMKHFKSLDNPAVWECIDKTTGKHVLTKFQAKHVNPYVKVDGPSIKGHWAEVNVFGIFTYKDYFIDDIDLSIDVKAQVWENSDKSMAAFQDDLLSTLCAGFASRFNYSEVVEPSVRVLLSTLNGGETAKCHKVIEIYEKKISENTLEIIWAYVTNGVEGAQALLTVYFIESLQEAGFEARGYLQANVAFKEAVNSLVRALCVALFKNGGDDVITLIYNAKDLFKSHYPELIFAWMMANDKNYEKDSIASKTFTPATRIVHINCPVNVEVYDKAGKLVASIIDNVPQEISDSLIQALYTADGEKQIFLPADEEYDIRIIATDNGTFNYTVDEYSYESYSHVKTVNFYDIPISSGDALTAKLPAYDSEKDADTTQGSSLDYKLFNKNGDELKADDVRVGEKAEKATYYVKAESNNEKAGLVSGSGNHILGSFAQVGAMPFEGCTFEGWYLNGNKVSEEYNYRFRVTGDTTIEAKFSGMLATPDNGAYKVEFAEVTGGYVITDKAGWYSPESKIAVSAQAESGYVFSHWKTSGSGYFENFISAETTFITGGADTVITAVLVPADKACSHSHITGGDYTANTCAKDGLISAVICDDCHEILQEKVRIPASGHRFTNGKCVDCGKKEKSSNKPAEEVPDEAELNVGLLVGIAAGALVLLAAIITTVIILVKKKKKRK